MWRSASTAIPPPIAELQLVAHQVDLLLASKLENDATDLEPPVFAGRSVRNLDSLEVIRPDQLVECPSGQLGDATFGPDSINEVWSRGEAG